MLGILDMANDGYNPIRVFVSYSHKDKRWLDRLQVHLKPPTRKYDIDLWDDTRLTPGSKWREEIRSAVDRANVAILIISADFLASEFVYTNELPPLLKAAREDGTLILPIIASPSLFLKNAELAQFQTVNSLASPLISASEGDQESTFLRVAEALYERVDIARDQIVRLEITYDLSREGFLEHDIWNRLIKIGDWILDEEKKRIIGSGMGAYLLSREEYGEFPFTIQTQLEFSNFQPPTDKYLGMNAGIVLGWKTDGEASRYYNVLLTGTVMLVERVGFGGGREGQDFEHITDEIPLLIERGKSYRLEVNVDEKSIGILVDSKHMLTLPRPTGIVGRVGLRPWRSQMDCTEFVVNCSVAL